MRSLVRRTLAYARLSDTLGIPTVIKVAVSNLLSITKIIKITIGSNTLFIRTSTPDIQVACLSLRKEYEPLRTLLPEDYEGIVVDAGGYIGSAAIKFSEMFPYAKVVTIEPSTENFELLEINVEPFENITAVKAALVPVFMGEIKLRNRGTGQWGFTVVDKPLDNPSALEIEKTKTITLDQIREMFGGEKIGLLKLDIEGGEKDLLENGGSALERVDVVFAELHDRIVDGCNEAFSKFSVNRWNLSFGQEKVLSLRKY